MKRAEIIDKNVWNCWSSIAFEQKVFFYPTETKIPQETASAMPPQDVNVDIGDLLMRLQNLETKVAALKSSTQSQLSSLTE